MEKELFALLRLGLRNSSPGKENLSDFIMMPAEMWAQLGAKAIGQGVLGVVLDGVDILEALPYGATRELSKQLKLEWIGQVMQIEQANKHQMMIMNDLAQKWIDKGYRVMVMKGQANSLMYPKPGHRSPGDIDCYLFENYHLGNDVAKKEGALVNEGWYKHSQISYKGELFENHLFFVHTREGKRSKQLQKELEQALDVNEWSTLPESKILIPPVQWNAMFLTYHACAHFLSEGLRLKQVLDWAMFLQKEQNHIDWKSFYDYCDRYHFRRFVDAMTAICVYYLGVQLSNNSIVKESPYKDIIINSALNDDDYIYNECKGLWKSRLYVLRSLFKYKWKYNEIYQQSIWKQLWWYITGFLFHTE